MHEAWGILHTAEQMLIALQPERTHHQQEALEQTLHDAGGYVSTYLPDHTWLVVGNARVAETARANPLVTWVVCRHSAQNARLHTVSHAQGSYTPDLKIDPIWKPLLALPPPSLHAALQAGDHPSLDDQAWRLLQGATQPCPSNTSVACLAVAVVFPPTVEVDPHAPPGAARLRSRARPARAASADWEAPLQRACGTHVVLLQHGEHQNTVLAPAHALADVLAWLAAQPAVHWLTPRWAVWQHNYEASAIIQSGQGSGNKAINDASVRPIWAAGITGTNQVVGMGDSGIGASVVKLWMMQNVIATDFNHCFFVDPTINLNADSAWTLDPSYGFPVFNSTRHRKIRLYYAFSGDRKDSNGMLVYFLSTPVHHSLAHRAWHAHVWQRGGRPPGGGQLRGDGARCQDCVLGPGARRRRHHHSPGRPGVRLLPGVVWGGGARAQRLVGILVAGV